MNLNHSTLMETIPLHAPNLWKCQGVWVELVFFRSGVLDFLICQLGLCRSCRQGHENRSGTAALGCSKAFGQNRGEGELEDMPWYAKDSQGSCGILTAASLQETPSVVLLGKQAARSWRLNDRCQVVHETCLPSFFRFTGFRGKHQF